MIQTITATPPFDLAKSSDALLLLEGADPGPRRRTIYRTWMDEGSQILVRLEDVGTVLAPEIECEVLAGVSVGWARILERLRRMLSLEYEPDALLSLAQGDERFTALLETVHGYHPVLARTPFEAAVASVLSQGAYPSGARAAWNRIVASLGTSIERDGRLHEAFPDPATILAHPEDLLLAVRRRAHAGTIIELAQLLRGELSDPQLDALSIEEVQSLLGRVRGVGPWTRMDITHRGLGLFGGDVVLGPAMERRIRAFYADPPAQELRFLHEQYASLRGAWLHVLEVFGPAPSRGDGNRD